MRVLKLMRLIFSLRADRIGADLPLIHILLYSKRTMRLLCKARFKFFGEDAEIRPHSFISGCKNISIGARTVIRPASFIYASSKASELDGGIVIENDVLIGNGVHVYASNHAFTDISIPISKQGHRTYPNIYISTGVWIGSNSVILPGVSIGKNSVIGAGSVVTKSVPANCLYAGNPARLIRTLTEQY